MVIKRFVESFIFYSSFGAYSRNSPARVKDLCHYSNELGKLLNKTDHYNFKSHKKKIGRHLKLQIEALLRKKFISVLC